MAKSADNFCARQYRQRLNPAMGVFAATATQAVLGAGRRPRGALWRRHRPVDMAMAGTVDGAAPILVIDHQTVAAPFYLPLSVNLDELRKMTIWLDGGAPPAPVRRLIPGEPIRCAEPGARARRRPAAGALLAVADAAIRSRKLAILALHPYDPDATGLHSSCALLPHCRLKLVFAVAQGFLRELDRFTLSDWLPRATPAATR